MAHTSQNYRKAVLLSVIALLPILLISNSITSFGQTNSTNNTSAATTTSGNATSNNQTNTADTNNPNNAIIQSIDSGISMIKSGDYDGAKKSLYQAESSLEDQPNQGGAEKHIEASLQALKDGDTNGALKHAEEAKNSLS